MTFCVSGNVASRQSALPIKLSTDILLDLGKPAGERALGTEVSLTPAPFASRLEQDGRVCFLDRLGRINVRGHAFLGEDRVDLFPNLGVELPPHGGDVFL